MRYLFAILICLPVLAIDYEFVGGNTSKLVLVSMYDSTNGSAKTALAFGDMTIAYTRNNASSDVDVTEVTMTMGTWASGGWIEVDATNSPGLYQFGLPNAAIADGAESVVVSFKAAGSVPKFIHASLIDVDLRAGISGYATVAALSTAQSDLDVLTGTDGAILATTQTNYAPNTTTPPTVGAIRTEMEGAGTKLTLALEDTGTTIPGLIGVLNDIDGTAVYLANGAHGGAAASLTLSSYTNFLTDVSGVATASALTTHDGKLDVVDANVDLILADTGELQTRFFNMIEADAADWRFVTNALEQAPSGGGGGDATAANQAAIISHLTDIKGPTWSASTDSLELIIDTGNADWTSTTGGIGSTPVSSDFGGADALTWYLTGTSTGVEGGIVSAYVASELAATPDTALRRGWVTTQADGSWSFLMLDSGTEYTLVYYATNIAETVKTNITP